ncbi:MAG: Spy/CpxP family protein refolding chaperone [Pyrinomonadaceae bacterium]
MKTRPEIMFALLAAGLVLNVAMVVAQQPAQKPNPRVQRAIPSVPALPSVPAVPVIPPVDPLAEVMFPPDLIMRHSRQLGLSNEQKTFMRDEIQRTTARFNELQWQLQDAMEALTEAMKPNSVNEQQALSLLERVLDTEREIKRLHISMGIRIKNQLTPPQQEKLQGMRMTVRPAEPL